MFFSIAFVLTLFVYVWITAKVVSRFLKKIVATSKWYRRIHRIMVSEWRHPAARGIGSILLAIFVILPLLVFLFLMASGLFYLEAREEGRRSADLKRRIEEFENENIIRYEGLKIWLKKHGVNLYYNTVNGITAVLTESRYQNSRQETEAARRDEVWGHEQLLPSKLAYLFVTAKGRQHIHSTVGGYWGCNSNLSYLYEIMKEAQNAGIDVKLHHCPEIFVPWANEALLPFREQEKYAGNGWQRSSYRGLIEAQAPKELQPLPRPQF